MIVMKGSLNMANLENILKNFDQNQIRQINEFLSTAQGQKLKSKITSSDKKKLLNEFARLDQNTINSRLKGLSREDLLKIIGSL